MNALPITIFVSVCLTTIFVLAFLREHLRRRDAGPEHESLLPLDDDDPPSAAPEKPNPLS